MVQTYTREHYSVIKNKEILPFLTTRMDPEGTMLSEIRQRKTNTAWLHLHVESKTTTITTKLIEKKISYSEERGRGKNWIKAVKRYKVPDIKSTRDVMFNMIPIDKTAVW